MKEVQVRLFAAFREAAGLDSETRSTEAATADELFEELCAAHPGLRRETAAKVAINDRMADWHSAIEDGDEILFFPPVAGG